jgi:hypothetical protein
MELAAAWKPPNDRRIEIDFLFFGPLERVDHPHHVVGPAGRLPVVKLPSCHET